MVGVVWWLSVSGGCGESGLVIQWGGGQHFLWQLLIMLVDGHGKMLSML